MRIATLIARLLLGLVFLAAGVSSFVIDLSGHAPPPMPGYAGDFQTLIFGSHFVLFTGAAQAVVGMLLLIGRYVPLALVTLAAILYNIFAFHVTMQPAMLVPVLVCIVLWVVVARAYAPNLRPLLEAKPPTSV
jgi:uncharacterized membrane protein YphA (DoxX/SURF4 family)